MTTASELVRIHGSRPMTFDDLKFEPRFFRPGVKACVFFENGYGASIIKGLGTYGYEDGLYELAVLHKNEADPDGYDLVYDTPITDDVLGGLAENEVTEVLAQIEALPPRIVSGDQ